MTEQITIPRATWDAVREALGKLLKRDQRNTCQHEETHRGGAIWEICEGCGMKWADDRGGKPKWKNPPEWDAAELALTAANAVSHPKTETTPSPEGGDITSESAANAVSPPQATEPAWRPIESAPKDGTKILVIGTLHNLLVPKPERIVASYKNGWWSGPHVVSSLTQWMPLPAATEAP